MDFQQKRKQPRVEFQVKVDVEVDSLLQTYYSKNLSTGGIFLEISSPVIPQEGSLLFLTFDIPAIGKKIQVQGKVVYQHSYESMDTDQGNMQNLHGIGISFIDVNEEDQKLIDQFIQGKELHVNA